jgi:hypothetical protein
MVAKRGRLVLHVRPQHLGLGPASERRLAGQALIQNAGERVLVRTCLHLPTSDLLGCEVIERARDLSGLCEAVGANMLRQPEVGQVGLTRLIEQHVRGLHVAVDEPLSVRGVERVCDVAEDDESPLGPELLLAVQQLLQISSFHEAGGEVERSVRLAGGEDGQDVRMSEGRRQARLVQKALPEARVPGQLGRDQLERDRPLER